VLKQNIGQRFIHRRQFSRIHSHFRIVRPFNDVTHSDGNDTENSQRVLSNHSACIHAEPCVSSQVGYGRRKAGCLNRTGGDNEPVKVVLSNVLELRVSS